MAQNWTQLGHIEIDGPELLLKDSAAPEISIGSGVLKDMKQGRWQAAALIVNEGIEGEQAALLVLKHASVQKNVRSIKRKARVLPEKFEDMPFTVGIMSGILAAGSYKACTAHETDSLAKEVVRRNVCAGIDKGCVFVEVRPGSYSGAYRRDKDGLVDMLFVKIY